MLEPRATVSLSVNGRPVAVAAPASARLSAVLRDELGLTGTKVGCDAGDCGACTVLVDGEAVCACLTAVGQAAGAAVTTVEGIGAMPVGARLQAAFLRRGAAQCGICTPGMLVAAVALLEREPAPDAAAVTEALGGVLCRCTGYAKIVDAVLDAGRPGLPGAQNLPAAQDLPEAGAAVGARVARLDGQPKVDGSERFGADHQPVDALALRVVRCPHHRARFALGDLDAWVAAHPGVARVLTHRDVPGENRYGVIPPFADQPVFAEGETRFRGEAVAAVVGERADLDALDLADFPVTFEPLPALLDIDAALAADAPAIHAGRPGNVLVTGRVARSDGPDASEVSVEGTFETGFVEHAYIEPEAGLARRVGDRIEIEASTQAPYMDRDDVAKILGLAPEAVRIVPSACGGGFGGKLDLSVQPFLALAAWLSDRPVRLVYTRRESMMTTTKRHPARIRMRVGATRDGRLAGIEGHADFNTGAYASWGPTVANRVPIHASGPYYVPHYRLTSRAVHTHLVPAGAFRGFGVPQAGIAQEQLFDALADELGLDRLEFRIANALNADQPTVTGQVLGSGVGIRACLEALRPHWARAREVVRTSPRGGGRLRRGVGVAGMWYGCGNTSLSNPSTIRLGLKPDGRLALHQGAVDVGQGSNTVIPQIAADALGAPLDAFDLVSADTDLTPDCGKTSASRQTFITGRAAELAGRALRKEILRAANAGEGATIAFTEAGVAVSDGENRRTLDLSGMPRDARGYVLCAEETFDAPTTGLDADGQGEPYAVYGFGAHMAEVSVDVELGIVKVLKVTAAHDVGRAINPTLIEGQIEGGVAQGLGLALMEEFHPGRGENLHDYLIPTIGDVPEIESILIEDPSVHGPFGAKGIGEQALIPTAPAILNAIRDATGVRIERVPATPDRVRAALKAGGYR